MSFWAVYIMSPQTIASLTANKLAKKEVHCWRYILQCVRVGACAIPLLEWTVHVCTQPSVCPVIPHRHAEQCTMLLFPNQGMPMLSSPPQQ